MAGLPNGQIHDSHSAPRQGLYPHISNSVPSTPYQKPRDLSRRFSRSPSPHHGLGQQSPRSVVSETVPNGSHRGAPVVCKFETGDEFRKRRMPYIEGGEQELAPPKKEPRTTLEPHEQDKLSGDMRELYDRLLPSQESEKRRAQLVHKLDRLLNDRWPGNDIRVNVFGSSGNLLSSTDSDVDICVTTPLRKLESMHALAELLNENGMEKVVCRAAAKVPIVKCWDPVLKLAMDLNVNNPLALQNTRLIKTYVQLDERVRPLAKIIKYWTKRRILNDAAFGATISSYTWICMIISFLQRREPPILPSLQKISDCRSRVETGELSSFADDVEALKGSGKENRESLGGLLFQFFRHYGYEFEYSKYVVSIKEGRLLSRKEKGWDPSNARTDKEARHRLCIEEPFTTHRNLGNTADEYAWHGIHLEIRRAFELLEDGLQLEKCCEQYEFPKEEKPVFQKPPPKPKPTLTRSASQSGQANREPGSGKARHKNNRNLSSQRTGNRRASSGASFSNQRLPFSPPLGTPTSDYFQLRSSLHEQLYLQYQYLQAQQDALRSQLAHQQQQQQTQARVGDLASSPRPRQYANGVPSPRLMDPGPPTAPLLHSYLYPYPARYLPPSPVTHARVREGTSTNPSSPSLIPAMPTYSGRRQVHRGSVPDGSASSVRSQSQPGRSLPHPFGLPLAGQAGYDLSAAPGGGHYHSSRSAFPFHQQAGQPGLHLPFSPYSAGVPLSAQTLDSAMPKEYVGYYVGQSPQLGPQQYATAGQMPPPPMTLRDPPTRQRRVTPDLMPPAINGRHSSRSPSPLGHIRSFSTTEHRASQPVALQSPSLYEPSVGLSRASAPVPAEVDLGGPLIVNGSNRRSVPKAAEIANGMPGSGLHLQTDIPLPSHQLPLRLDIENATPERPDVTERGRSSSSTSPTSKPHSDRIFSPRSPPNGTPPHLNGVNGHYHENTPLSAAPLLSPVAELRTPSPTQSRSFEAHESPETNGNLFKAAKIANAKHFRREFDENHAARTDSKHDERRKSAPPPSSDKSQTAAAAAAAAAKELAPEPMSQSNQNSWQQVAKKGHKKNKSVGGTRSPIVSGGGFGGGQPLPANESERKGG